MAISLANKFKGLASLAKKAGVLFFGAPAIFCSSSWAFNRAIMEGVTATNSAILVSTGTSAGTSQVTVQNLAVDQLSVNQCVQTVSSGGHTKFTTSGLPCGSGSGGSGSSALGVGIGGPSGYSLRASSPTTDLLMDSNTFTASLQGGATALYTLLPSSVTLQGNTNLNMTGGTFKTLASTTLTAASATITGPFQVWQTTTTAASNYFTLGVSSANPFFAVGISTQLLGVNYTAFNSSGPMRFSATGGTLSNDFVIQPGSVAMAQLFGTHINSQFDLSASSLAITGANGANVTYGLTVGSVTATSATVTGPAVIYSTFSGGTQNLFTVGWPGANPVFTAALSNAGPGLATVLESSAPIYLSANGGTTDDIQLWGTNSQAGSGVVINENLQANTANVPFGLSASSINVTGANGIAVTYGVTASSIAVTTATVRSAFTAGSITTIYGVSASSITASSATITGPLTVTSTFTAQNYATFSSSLSATYITNVYHTGTPSLSSCGGTPTITGNDRAGTITGGTGSPTACTVSFATTWTSAPFCVASTTSTVTVTAAALPSTSQFVINSSTSIASQTLQYLCSNGKD